MIISRRESLKFTLDDPFERSYQGIVSAADGGITLRHVVGAIRAAFHTMYQGTTSQDAGNLHTEIICGKYGTAVHRLGDLVIERIDVVDDAGLIEIGLGS